MLPYLGHLLSLVIQQKIVNSNQQFLEKHKTDIQLFCSSNWINKKVAGMRQTIGANLIKYVHLCDDKQIQNKLRINKSRDKISSKVYCQRHVWNLPINFAAKT